MSITTRGLKVPVFLSYAGGDYDAYPDWFKVFEKMMLARLRAKIRNAADVSLYSYRRNGSVAGDLRKELAGQIERAAAMVMFVHENYLGSDDCRFEWETFVRYVGREKLDTRLFPVALSRRAWEELRRQPSWKDLVDRDRVQLCSEYFGTEVQLPGNEGYGSPMPAYLKVDEQTLQPNPSFSDLLDRLVSPLAAAIVEHATVAPRSMLDNHRTFFIGACSPDLQAEVDSLEQELKKTGADVRRVKEDDLSQIDLAAEVFNTPGELLLPYHDGALRLPNNEGGHLNLQRQAWERAGNSIASLQWIDMRHVPPARAPSEKQKEAMQALIRKPVTPAQFLAQLRPRVSTSRATIYIESNANELDHWDGLGRRLLPHWLSVAENGRPPKLAFGHMGLPINREPALASLADADGVILLWGKKEPESLVAQISSVESRLDKDDLAPGIVAYLMPPRETEQESVPAYGWKVLRFNAPNEDDIDVVSTDAERLRKFLRAVHARVEKRQADARAGS